MKAILLLLLLVCAPLLASTPPPQGTYVFTREFTLEGVSEYEGGRGVAVHPVKTQKKVYKPGDLIQVDEFFWDDHTKTWGAKTVFLGTNRSIPMEYLKLRHRVPR